MQVKGVVWCVGGHKMIEGNAGSIGVVSPILLLLL